MSDQSQTAKELRRLLVQQFSPFHLSVIDDSAKHAGHTGVHEDSGHFTIVIVSHFFENRSLVERHRFIYQTVQSLMQERIHALAIKALTPVEWDQADENPNRKTEK
ncbi:MAG: BolA family transcriptional regulator [Candidatus Omnitrophica bacterium CG11_big_fil_rev_8_21_14_0_20_45_26]|uniref:BolA family transcriptional regulator n=1 Tax=Candidatus Abzuiibacterium crystallinum TaxID=1974748 RepID=A0A2H0LNF5_9BACT|nr:MAG: BolA family transcriptional regulator [Candidatus Omnitrophica bacterium CG11_big_fil_rev_8_21_14_0_20_45_26]PIW63898.1 MAG: BolA family transcriptional regulator [Candidatus Omnitrophica bacterium CG12_big_fil_rev_8_21_14_0_65_45_16]